MKIVTSGKPYLDIDAYASCIGYMELLNLQGKPAIAVSTSERNESIPLTVRSWGAPLSIMYNPTSEDTFILVDVSDPESLDDVVIPERVEEIIDHHPGFEAHWRAKLGDALDVEFIGAACTMVYERWQKAGIFEKISEMSARLLLTGILDNSLNFKAEITTQRDRDAYSHLFAKAHLSEGWPRQYFSECQTAIEGSIGTAIRNDVKSLAFPFLKVPIRFGQLTTWNSHELLTKRKNEVMKTLDDAYNSWILNIISIEEGKSYILSRDPKIQKPFSELLGIEFSDDMAVASRLWLRKEMSKAAQDATKK